MVFARLRQFRRSILQIFFCFCMRRTGSFATLTVISVFKPAGNYIHGWYSTDRLRPRPEKNRVRNRDGGRGFELMSDRDQLKWVYDIRLLPEGLQLLTAVTYSSTSSPTIKTIS